MTTRLLDAAEFKATFVEPMRDVTDSATNVVDIWPYVEAIPTGDLCDHRLANGLVERVYRNGNDALDHILVVTQTKNVFLVVIVDLAQQAILGHHLLDLNIEYGLPSLQ